MGFYGFVNENYGREAVQLFNEIKKTYTRISKIRNKKIFLIRCRSSDIIPRHIQQNVRCLWPILPRNNFFGLNIDKIIKKFQFSILSLEIKISFCEEKYCNSCLNNLINNIRMLVPSCIVNEFLQKESNKQELLFNRIKIVQIKKYDSLLQKRYLGFRGDSKWVYNTTDCVIPDPVVKFLSLGEKFALNIECSVFPIKRVLADVEFCLSNLVLNDIEREKKRTCIINAINSFKRNRNSKIFKHTPLYKQMVYTTRFLKSNPNVMVLKADKGNSTVLMNRNEYIQKMTDLFQNDSYKILKDDPTKRVQVKNNLILKHLYEDGYISESKRISLSVHNSQPPRAYGLPKVHKPNFPLRPVISCVNCPTSKLAKYLVSILNNLSSTFVFGIKNSVEFVDRVKEFVVPEGYVMVSFDVVSLFSNVTVEAVLKSVEAHWIAISDFTDIPLDRFIILIKFIFENSYFSSNNVFYKQVSGCAMGNPVSPIFANLVLNDLLMVFMDCVKSECEIPLLLVYVDDLFCCLPDNKIDGCLSILNSLDSNISFTVERECNKVLPYLDMLVHNIDDKIYTEWYRKECSVDRILPFDSYHPFQQKIGIIKQFKLRVIGLCSERFVSRSLLKLKNMFMSSGYPSSLINSVLYGNFPISMNVRNVNEQVTKYFKIPFIRQLAPIFKHLLQSDTHRIAFYNVYTLRKFFNTGKDFLPNGKKSNVVYKIPCSCGREYVGQSSQLLVDRIYQHEYDIKKGLDKTALSLHITESGHFAKFDDVKVVEIEQNTEKRLLLEMMHIFLTADALNLKTDFHKLNVVYRQCLQ